MALCFLPFLFPQEINTTLFPYFLPGYFWLCALFASILSIQQVFHSDMEDHHLEQLFLSECPFTFIIGIKLLVQWMITEIPLILLTGIFGLILQLSNTTLGLLCLTLLLGTPLLTLLGSFTVALTWGLQQSGLLLSVLILPLATPVIIFGVNIIQQADAGLKVAGPLAFLAGITLFGITLLPLAIASVLRLSVE